jgi:hypothetical protein
MVPKKVSFSAVDAIAVSSRKVAAVVLARAVAAWRSWTVSIQSSMPRNPKMIASISGMTIAISTTACPDELVDRRYLIA